MAEKIKVNVEAVKAALVNSRDPFDADIRGVEVVNPALLTIDSRFYGIEVNPITPKEKMVDLPFTSNYVAVKETVVNSVAVLDDNTVTVNGNIDLPRKPGGVVKVKDLFFTNQEDAKQVCAAITEVYLDRMMRIQDVVKKEVDYLTNQLDKGDF